MTTNPTPPASILPRRGLAPGVLRNRIVAGVGLSLVGLFLVWLAINFVKAPSQFLDVLWIGITLGAIYGLVALGYTLVYGILELINFAHGDVFMLCAMMTASLLGWFALSGDETGIVLWALLLIVLILAMVFGAGVNAAVEFVAYRRLRGSPRLVPLITAVGMSFILQNVGLAWKGATSIGLPNVLPAGDVFDINGVSLAWKDLFVWLVTVPVLFGLVWLVQRTKPGKAMRAVAQDQSAAAMMGIDVNRVISFTFAVAGALAGAAGLLYGLWATNVRFDTGFQLGLIAFTAAVLGGIGNLPGAVAGAAAIGFIQAFNEGLSWYAPGTNWTQSIVFSILILILVFRPEGILGERTPEGQ